MTKKPLTPEEITAASELFFEAFNIVDTRMPKGSKVEDTIKCMEEVKKIASVLRQKKEKDERDAKFGFNKTEFLE